MILNNLEKLAPDHIAVVGVQMGDEGKGKLVDLLSARAKVVVRYNGGNNAGHTVIRNGEVFKFRSLPSGAGIPGILNIIGNGAVVNILDLLNEIKQLEQEHNGLKISPKELQISEQAHIVLPLHKELDVFREEMNRGTASFIGTTGNGIGPSYSDKAARIGIRAGDLLYLENEKAQRNLLEKIRNIVVRHFPELELFAKTEIVFEKRNAKNEIILYLSAKELYPNIDAVVDRIMFELKSCASAFAPYVASKIQAYDLLKEADLNRQNILYEGGQSILLDIDHGTVPYVTSSSTGGNAIFNGTGYKTKRDLHVIGVAKAYVTRVGRGPFPTKMSGAEELTADLIRRRGGEFGTVTGRMRDIGWFDLVAVKQAVQVGGIHSLALMKADILDDFANIRVAVSYNSELGTIERIPMQSWLWDDLRVNYVTLKGWKNEKPVFNAKSLDELPPSFLEFVHFIEKEVNVPIAFIGTGPERSQIIQTKA